MKTYLVSYYPSWATHFHQRFVTVQQAKDPWEADRKGYEEFMEVAPDWYTESTDLCASVAEFELKNEVNPWAELPLGKQRA